MDYSKNIKLLIIGISAIVIVSIPLIRANFYADPTIIKWRKLEWTDFQGIPKPFTSYGASINSDVYLEYDSVAGTHYAYAGQNNQRSWRKMEDKRGYGLNHEQYHFNITEWHARQLNEFINSNPDISRNKLNEKLNEIRKELSYTQKQYDDETDHSLNQDIQRLWEFKIDTLLENSKHFTEPYTKTTFQIPFELVYSDSVLVNEAIRIYEGFRYDIKFQIMSSLGPAGLDSKYLKSVLINSPHVNVLDSAKENFKALNYFTDSASNTINYELISFNDYHLTEFRMAFKRRSENRGYHQIVNTIISEFHYDESYDKSIYMDSYPESLSGFQNYPKTKYQPGMICYVNNTDSVKGFYGKPFLNINNDIVIPFQILNHDLNEIHETVVLYGNESIISIPDSIHTNLVIPAELTNPAQTDFFVGFTLRKDTAQGCFQYYCQLIQLEDFFY